MQRIANSERPLCTAPDSQDTLHLIFCTDCMQVGRCIISQYITAARVSISVGVNITNDYVRGGVGTNIANI